MTTLLTPSVGCTVPEQATWAVVRAAVPLLKQVVGGKLEAAPPALAPGICAALARLAGRSAQGGRTFAGHIFKECESGPVVRVSVQYRLPSGSCAAQGGCASAATLWALHVCIVCLDGEAPWEELPGHADVPDKASVFQTGSPEAAAPGREAAPLLGEIVLSSILCSISGPRNSGVT